VSGGAKLSSTKFIYNPYRINRYHLILCEALLNIATHQRGRQSEIEFDGWEHLTRVLNYKCALDWIYKSYEKAFEDLAHIRWATDRFEHGLIVIHSSDAEFTINFNRRKLELFIQVARLEHEWLVEF